MSGLQISVHVVDVEHLHADVIVPLSDPDTVAHDEIEELRERLAQGEGGRELVALALARQTLEFDVRIADEDRTLGRWRRLEGTEFPVVLSGSISALFATLPACGDLDLVGGLYIPARHVAAAREWLREAIARGLDAGWLKDRRELSPIVRVLDRALSEGRAYWESPTITIIGDSVEPGVESIYEDELTRHAFARSPLALGPHGLAEYWVNQDVTKIPAPERIDEATAQVHFEVDVPGRAWSVTYDTDGVAIVVTATAMYEVRDHDLRELPRVPASWAARVDGRIVALSFARDSAWELVDGTWRSSRLDLLGIVRRTRGVVATPPGYLALDAAGLVQVDAAGERLVVACAGEHGALFPGPDGAAIVTLGPNREGRVGFVRIADGRIVEVTPSVCGFERVHALAYDPITRSLITAADGSGGVMGGSRLPWSLLVQERPAG